MNRCLPLASLLVLLTVCPLSAQEVVNTPLQAYGLHDAPVIDASPDGARLALVDGDSLVRIVDAETGEDVLLFGQDGLVRYAAVAWSPLGTVLATCGMSGSNGEVALWDPTTGELLRQLPLTGSDEELLDVAFSADGNRMAAAGSASGAYDGLAAVWDVATGVEVRRFELDKEILGADLSTDGSVLLVSQWRDGVLLDVATGAELLRVDHDDEERVTDVAFAPDGNWFVTAGGYDATTEWGSIRRWDAITGDQLQAIPPAADLTEYIERAELSSDGERLITGTCEGLAVWDVATGAQLFADRPPVPGYDWEGTTPAVTFVGAGHDRVAQVQLVDTDAGDDLHVTMSVLDVSSVVPDRTFAEARIRAVALSTDGTKAATGLPDGEVTLWDVTSGARLYDLAGHTNDVYALAFSPDGSVLASASADTTARLWSTTDGSELHQLANHSDGVYDVVFSPDGSRVLTASRDRSARVWSVASGAELHVESVSLRVNACDWGGEIMLAVGTTLVFYDPSDWTELRSFTHPAVQSARLSPDGQRVVVGSSGATYGAILDTLTGNELSQLDHYSWINDVAWSPSGSRIATADHEGITRLWDATGNPRGTVEHINSPYSVAINGSHVLTGAGSTAQLLGLTRPDPVQWSVERPGVQRSGGTKPVALSPDGRRVLVADDGWARLYDAASSELLVSLGSGTGSEVQAVALSGDGVRAATGHWDGSVNIWRLDTGELERQLPGHSNWIASLAFSPDGELLASGSTDDWARVWDVATGVERYPLAHVNDVRVVAFSPDGELLLTGADEAYLWTASTGAAVRTLTTDLPVKTAVFSPDSSRVLTRRKPGLTVYAAEYDVATGIIVNEWALSQEMNAAAYLSDGQHALIGLNWPHTVGLWDLASHTEERTFIGLYDAPAQIVTSADGSLLLVADEQRQQALYDTGLDATARVAEPIGAGDSLSGTAHHLLWRDFAVELSAPVTGLVATLQPTSGAGSWQLLARVGALPTLTQYDVAAIPTADGTFELTVTDPPLSGLYLSVRYEEWGSGGDGTFVLAVDAAERYLIGIDPDEGGNSGTVTSTVHGLGFSDGVTVELRDGGTPLTSAVPTSVRPTTLAVSLDLTGLAIGPADLAVIWPDRAELVRDNAFSIVAGSAPTYAVRLVGSDRVRHLRPTTLLVELENTGTIDLPAPLLELESLDGLSMRVADDRPWRVEPIRLLMTGPAGEGSVPPGTTVSAAVEVLPQGSAHQQLYYRVSALDNELATIDWPAQEPVFKPTGVDATLWQHLWPAFTAEVGTTWGDYRAKLLAVSGHLSTLGRVERDPARLLGPVWNHLLGGGVTPVLSGATDAAFPAPGGRVVLARWYESGIESRFASGRFGRGWVDSWQLEVEPLSGGIAVRRGRAAVRRFTQQLDGDYTAMPGNSGTLLATPSGWLLVEADGSRYEFDTNGQLVATISPHGFRVEAEWIAGQLVALEHGTTGDRIELSYDAFGQVELITDHAGQQTWFSYDPVLTDHLLSVEAPGSRTTSYAYNGIDGLLTDHALTEVTDAGGAHLELTYDTLGRLTEMERDGNAGTLTWSYPSIGVTALSTADGEAGRLLWDERGRLAGFEPFSGGRLLAERSTDGDIVRVTMPSGTSWWWEWGPLHRPVVRTAPNGDEATLLWSFPMNGGALPVALIDEQDRLTRVLLDGSGWVEGIEYPDLSEETYLYGADDLISDVTNRRGTTIELDRNPNGQVIERTVATDTVTYGYDTAARLETVTTAAGTTTVTYDARGLPVRVDEPTGRWREATWDDAGRLTGRTDSDGFAVTYSYDTAGRLDEVRDQTNRLLASYSYDTAGRLARKDLGNGAATTFGYDALGRLDEVTHLAPGGAVRRSETLEHNTDGRPVERTVDGATTSYSYDSLGRLVTVTWPDFSVWTYAYDSAGNRTLVDRAGSSESYTANDVDQYTAVGADTVSWDDDGNLLTRSGPAGTSTLTWDAENRLLSVDDPTNGLFSYGYDGIGLLQTEQHGGTSLVLDRGPIGLAGEYAGDGSLIARHVFSTGPVLRQLAGGDEYWYQFDALGATCLLTDDSGSIVANAQFGPYGEPLAPLPDDARFGFLGRWGAVTFEHGLISTPARWYDPSLGRFLSVEPLRLQQGPHLYTYADNSPLARVDTDGLTSLGTGSDANNASSIGVGMFSGGGGLIGGWLTGTISIVSGFIEAFDEDGGPNYQGTRVHGGGNVGAGTFGVLESLVAFVSEGSTIGTIEVVGLSTPIAVPVTGIILVDEWYTHLYIQGLRTHHHYDAAVPNPYAILDTAYPDGNVPDDVMAALDDYVKGQVIRSNDPNEKLGPFGEGSLQAITVDEEIAYTVFFENLSSASAPAQEVLVSDALDPDLDWSTVRLTEVAWSDETVAIASGAQFATRQTIMDWRDGVLRPWWLDITGELRPNGTIQWRFRTLDPETGELPTDPDAGFLPANDSTSRGEGHVSFVVRPRVDLADGTELLNDATITFDSNAPITTNSWRNLIWSGPCDPWPDATINAADLAVELRVIADPTWTPPGSSECDLVEGASAGDLLWLLSALYP